MRVICMRTALLVICCLLTPWFSPTVGTKEIVARTGGMLPTIPIDATLTVDESTYASRNPKRFDIVLVKRRYFQNPADRTEKTMEVVSRVIGLPGENISLRNGQVFINGKRVVEPFTTKSCPKTKDESLACAEMPAIPIPRDEYFLLGDNRAESEDSRLWSPVTIKKSDLVGRVVKITRSSQHQAQ